MLHAVIMAGGAGTRFWPESRAARPKQLLRLVGERSMLAETAARLGALIPPERVLVVTNAALVDACRGELPRLPAAAVIGEPCKRDTAPCIALAALTLVRSDPDALMAVMPSDHAIAPAEKFRSALRLAAELVAERPSRLVTFGVRPTYPAESFGYIERGQPLALPALGQQAAADWQPGGPPPVFAVRKFHEKPSAAVSQTYLAAGNYYWNAGIFVWRAQTILDELRRHEPAMLAHLERIAASVGRPEYASVLTREFTEIVPRSIDYAVMERATNVAVIEAPFAWDDVGSWQAIARLAGADAQGNTIAGRHLGHDTTGSIVRTGDDHLVVTLGVHDLIVVHTPDATLVADKRQEESLRKLVKLLEEQGWKDVL